MNAQHSTENLSIPHKVKDYGTWRKSFKLWVALAFTYAIVIAGLIQFLSADEWIRAQPQTPSLFMTLWGVPVLGLLAIGAVFRWASNERSAMSRKSSPKPDNPEHKRFVDMAHEVEADENQTTFDLTGSQYA